MVQMWRLTGLRCENSGVGLVASCAVYRAHISPGNLDIQPSTSQSNGTFDKFRSVKMSALPQFDYLFAIGTLFAFLDAWNIGKRSPPLILVTLLPQSRHDTPDLVYDMLSNTSLQVPTMWPIPSQPPLLLAHSRSSKPCALPPSWSLLVLCS
jgi:hypothetical protein